MIQTRDQYRKDRQAFDLSKLFDQAPPAAIEHEMCLLGSMLLASQAIEEAITFLDGPDDFYKPAHGVIYDVLTKMHQAGEPIELVNINQRLRDLGQLDAVGGTAYLVQLGEQVPSPASAPYYAGEVRNAAAKRALIDAAANVLHDAYRSGDKSEEQIARAQAAVMTLAEKGNRRAVSDLSFLQERYDELARLNGTGVSGLPTGMRDLDEKLLGIADDDLVIVAARPSIGKTAFALTICHNLSIRKDRRGLLFSMEMSANRIGDRLLAMDSGVDRGAIRRNQLSRDSFEQLSLSVGRMAEAPFMIDDTPGLNTTQLAARARLMQHNRGLDYIVIDYLQLMRYPGLEKEYERVSAISVELKELARSLKVPVICLAQLNRGPESRESHRPRMSDLRGSGSIEQDADTILLLHREEFYHKDDDLWRRENPHKIGLAEVIVDKQRDGVTGTVEMLLSNRGRFEDLSAGDQLY